MAKIYTRYGDQGMTSLLGGTRLSKSHPRLHAYGTIDELNVQIGVLHSKLESESAMQLGPLLVRIQQELFVAGGLLACDNAEWLTKIPQLQSSMVTQLENEIDQWSQSLPDLKNFILPGGTSAALSAHMARVVCRRAERWTLAVFEETKISEYELVVKYLNRLSDYFFTLSRWINYQNNKKETLWIPS